MKKFFLLGAVAALALAACQKEQPAEPQSGLVYDGKNVIEIAEGTNFYTVTFKANKDWEALINAPDLKSGDPSVTIDKTKGTTGDQSIKVTFEDLEEGDAGRPAILCVSTGGFEDLPAAGEYFIITFIQGKVFLVATEGEDVIGAEGGEVSYQIITNCAYETKKYDAFEEWAPATIADNVLKFDVKPNDGYDSREAYVKFTVNEIQVPVYDPESGEPTGDTEAYVTRAYVNQAGNASYAWAENIDDRLDHTLEGKMSIALFDGDVYVCDGIGVFAFDKNTGAYKSQLPAAMYGDIVPRCITADEAGHLLVAGEGGYGDKVEAYLLKDSKTNGTLFLSFYVDAWNGGNVGKFRVVGDLTGKAAVTAFYGGLPSYGGVSYALTWQITDGTAVWAAYGEEGQASQPDFFQMTNVTGDVWDQNGFCVAPVGENVSDGLYFMGYESPYTFQKWDGATWTALFTGGSEGNHGYSSINTIEWNGNDYIAVVEMSFFPFWYEKSTLYLVDADDDYKIVSNEGILGGDIRCDYDWDTYSTTGMTISADSFLCEEDGQLVGYVVDGGQNRMYKKVFPVLD